MYALQSENKHLWFAVDFETDAIVKVFINEQDCFNYIQSYRYRSKVKIDLKK